MARLTRTAKLPRVRVSDPNLQRFVDALTSLVEVREGLAGESEDGFIRWRDLLDTRVVRRRPGPGGVGGGAFEAIPTPGLPIFAIPPAVQEITASGAVQNIILTWRSGLVLIGNWSHEEIYRAETNVIGEEVKIGESRIGMYTDNVGPGKEYWYWVAMVNTQGVRGPLSPVEGVHAETAIDVSYMLDILGGQITESQLFSTLGERIALIDDPSLGLVKKVGDLETTYGTTASAAQSASDALGARSDAISAKADALGARSDAISAKADVLIAQGLAEDAAVDSRTDRIAAEVARDSAGDSASAAFDSATNAAAYATDAGSAATISTNQRIAAEVARDSAGDSASAAFDSATNAAASATDAGSAAGVATSMRDEAVTLAGNASTSAINAATSSSDALGFRNQASTSAGVAASSRDAAVKSSSAVFPSDFQNDGLHFVLDEPSGFNPDFIEDSFFRGASGAGRVFFSNGYRILGPRAFLPSIPGRTYYVEARVRVTQNSTSTGGSREQLFLGLRGYNAAGGTTSNFFSLVSYAGSVTSLNPLRVANGWVTVGGVYTVPAFPAQPYLRPRLYMGLDGSGNGNAVWEVSSYVVKDITEALVSQQAASAAADSASSAFTAQTNSEISAGAATVSRVAAEVAAFSSPILPSGFQNGLVNWTTARGGNPTGPPSHQNLTAVSDDVTFGFAGNWTPSTAGQYVNTRGLISAVGRRIRVTARFRVVSIPGGGTVSFRLGAWANTAEFTNTFFNATTAVAFGTGVHILTAVFAGQDAPGVSQVASDLDTHPWARFGLGLGQSKPATIRIGSISVEDVTSELTAESAASAAVTSASNAKTWADDAGEYAEAAFELSTQAGTSRGDALTFRNEASQAKTDAETARTEAQIEKGLAVTARNQTLTALNSSAEFYVRPIPELAGFGTGATGLPEAYSVIADSAYAVDGNGPYVRRSGTSGGNALFTRAVAAIPSNDHVFRVTARVRSVGALLNLGLHAQFLNSSGGSVRAGTVVSQAVANGSIVTLSTVFGRQLMGLVTHTGSGFTASDWNNASLIRFGVRVGTGVASSNFDIFDIRVEDLTEASKATQSASAALSSVGDAEAWADEAELSAGAAITAKDTVLATATGFDSAIAWDFDGGLQSWVGSGATVALQGGSVLRVTSSGTNPSARSPTISIPGGKNILVRVRARRVAGSGWQGRLLYRTSGHSESTGFRKDVPNTTVLNEWRVLEFDMTALTAGGSDWVDNTITRIMIRLGSTSADVFDIDWVAVGRIAPVAYSAAIETMQKATADSFGHLTAQYGVKVDIGGHVSGFGLLSSSSSAGGAESQFGIRADRFFIAPPTVNQAAAPTTNLYKGMAWRNSSTDEVRYWSGTAWLTTPQALPFAVQQSPTVVNGEEVPAGVYIDTAYIRNGTITSAQIGTVGVDKITGDRGDFVVSNIGEGTITNAKIGNVIESANWPNGGWQLHKNGQFVVRDANGQVRVVLGQLV